jgi:DNA-binding PadR family transcriptional regulator
MPARRKLSPLSVALLALLRESPMHPYQMQVLIRQRAKDDVINVRQRASLYTTIERLLAAGLVAVRATERDPKRPERTVYELTDTGRVAGYERLREMLAQPADEFPEFPAALSLLPVLTVDDALAALDERLAALDAAVAKLDADTATAEAMGLPRLFQLEGEQLRVVTVAEREWVASVIDDLRRGTLFWSDESIAELAAQFEPKEPPVQEDHTRSH